MKHIICVVRGVLLILIAISGFGVSLAEEAVDSTATQVLEAWKKRAESYPTVRLKWREEYTRFVPPENPFAAEPIPKAEAGYPKTTPKKYCLVLNSNRVKLRFYNVGDEKSAREKSFDGKSVGMAITGSERRDNEEHPHGRVMATTRFGWATMMGIRPVAWYFRPLSPAFRLIKLEELERKPGEATIRGASCIVFTKEFKDSNYNKHAYFIDPNLDYSIVRFTVMVNNTIRWQVDIDYQRLDDSKLALKSWQVHEMAPDGSMIDSRVAEVASVELDSLLTEDDFAIRFPPGTFVEDEVSGTWFISRENEGRRLVQKYEKAATYEQLLRSETGQALRPYRSTNWLPYLAAAGALAAAVLLFFRWKSNQTSQ